MLNIFVLDYFLEKNGIFGENCDNWGGGGERERMIIFAGSEEFDNKNE